MAKAKRLDWSEIKILGGAKPTKKQIIVKHFRKHGILYAQIVLTAVGIILVGPHAAFAAGGSLDDKGMLIYRKIISLGKWVIIIKGGIDMIQTVSQGDFQTAKQHFMAYLLIYAALLALPWGINQVDSAFS